METVRRREEELGAAKEEADAAREKAELKMEEAFAELGKRDREKEVLRIIVFFLLFTGICDAIPQYSG